MIYGDSTMPLRELLGQEARLKNGLTTEVTERRREEPVIVQRRKWDW